MTDLEIMELEGGLKFWTRTGTNDHSTIYASAHEDEYGLSDEDVYGKLVFDVGAYVGSVGVWLASRGARVVCVEPVPVNADLIRRNAELNEVDVVVVEAAAGEEGEQIVRWGFTADPDWNDRVAEDVTLGALHTDQTRISIAHHGFVGSTHRDAPVDQAYEERVVPSMSLARLVQEYGVPYIIKIDCEGGEWPWLADPLMQFVRLVVGEWHPWDTVQGAEGVGGFRGYRGAAHDRCNQDSIRALLDTHLVEFSGPEGGPGGFRATR